MRNPTRSDDGFSLGEAMVAIALTMIVLSAAVETMARSMALATTSRVISATNHGLQAAMSFMVRDIMQTGQGIPLGGIPLPSGAGAVAVNRPGPGAMQFPLSLPTLPALAPGNGLGPTLLGVQTDIISVLYADRTLDLRRRCDRAGECGDTNHRRRRHSRRRPHPVQQSAWKRAADGDD
jgi:type II secretory pathway pseudopilin PulG